MKLNRQNILAIILVLTLIAGIYVWYIYFFSVEEEVVVLTPEPIVSDEFLAKVILLEQIKIDTEFLKSQALLQLQSGAKLPPLTGDKGRLNPFGRF